MIQHEVRDFRLPLKSNDWMRPEQSQKTLTLFSPLGKHMASTCMLRKVRSDDQAT